MFFFGASVTLSGVYLLSKREMNVLRPAGKFRAAVKMIIFIKRAQKARNIEHRWVLPPSLSKCEHLDVATAKSAQARPKGIASGLKLSKASVMPVDSSKFPLVAATAAGAAGLPDCPTIELTYSSKRERDDARTALDSSASQLDEPKDQRK